MIPVAGKPVIEHIMRGLMGSGINEFIVIIRHLGEKIRDYFGNGECIGAKVSYVNQTDKYGTGAALLMAKELAAGEQVLMTYGDIITSERNYAGAIDVFNSRGCDAVMTLNWMDDPWAGGAVHVDDSDEIFKIVEKPPKGEVPSHWNSAGIMVFQPVIFEYLECLKPSTRGEYELPDAINAMIGDGYRICPYYLKGPWRDVGRVEDIAAAEAILMQQENVCGNITD